MSKKNKSENIFIQIHPLVRLLISVLISGFTFIFIRSAIFDWLMLSMILWIAFALSYILMSLTIFFTCPATRIRKIARKEDLSRFLVFFVVIISSFASMFNVLLLVLSKDSVEVAKAIYLPVAIGGMLLSWVMIHITFTFHYAHIYYDDDNDDPEIHAEGLTFPNEKNPDYLDFAYFSFILGMTFQVSDVEITSKRMRRLALLHGMLSFGLFTFVVALAINLIAGLRG